MTSFFQNASPLEMVFWWCALVGTIFFVGRLIILVVTGGMDVDMDLHPGAHGDVGHPDSSFEALSLNTITAFVMMFGWIGLACLKQFHMEATAAIAAATGAGLLCMLTTAYFFKQAKKLASGGSAFSMDKTIGKKATVYQKIPGQGRGKITLSVGDMTHEIEAVSAEQKDIASFVTVEVVRVVDQRTVAVKQV